MRIPDLRHIVDAPRRVLRAFPWTAGAALVLCASSMALNHLEGEDADQVLSRLMMAAGWGISLFFLAEVLSRGKTTLWSTVFRVAPVAVVGGWFLLVPHPMGLAQWSQYYLLGIATHLGVSLARGSEENEFWHWNRLLFQRVVESSAFSIALGAGASGALWTLEKLFSVDLPNECWGDLWIFVGSIFATFQFLSGIPEGTEAIEEHYPAYLRLFSTRVLLPLAMAYLALLYVYLAKIVGIWSLPVGLVSSPILAFAGFGILAHLLLHPLGTDGSRRWVVLWIRWFHLLLLPLCGLLAVAIGRRLFDYGITEERYLVLVLAAWLPVQAAWFLLGGRSLRFVPASLLLLCLVCGWGPWGAFESSRRSQLTRLESILSGIEAVPGVKVSAKVPRPMAKEITGLVQYLCENHQGRGLERWSPSVARMRNEQDERRSNRYGGWSMTDSVMASLGIPSVARWESDTVEFRKASLNWSVSAVEFPARTRLERIDAEKASPFLEGARFVVERDGVRLVFDLDTLRALPDENMPMKEFLDPFRVSDSAGRADLILEQASLEKPDVGPWRIESLRGLLLR